MLKKLSAYPRQNGLAKALREIGRIERTLFTLDWIKNPDLRRRAHLGLNKGEARNALARAVYFCRLGEMRDRTFENQFFRASGLNLLVAAIILWNTRYLEAGLSRAATAGPDGQRGPASSCRAARLGAHRPDRRLRLERLPTSLAPVRSGHCGSGNRCWRREFSQRSRCRTLRALSCSDPSSASASATGPRAR